MKINKDSLNNRYSIHFEEAFLKCDYFPRNFSTEYFIKFRGSEYPWSLMEGVFIDGEKLIRQDDSKGLVKVLASQYGSFSSIVIDGSKEDAGKFYSVPNEDLVYGKEEIISGSEED
ncbi:MAG: hypothetical protein NUV46_00435 [Nanoarchaeota archaeon]|nr:hypothetical protein [Nanoarchaeota archaeon]